MIVLSSTSTRTNSRLPDTTLFLSVERRIAGRWHRRSIRPECEQRTAQLGSIRRTRDPRLPAIADQRGIGTGRVILGEKQRPVAAPGNIDQPLSAQLATDRQIRIGIEPARGVGVGTARYIARDSRLDTCRSEEHTSE